MAKINVVFNVPNWVEAGRKSGDLRLFGGVVRDNSGQIVYMLKEGAQQAAKTRNGKIVIAFVAAATVAGAGYYIYKKCNKKAAAQDIGGQVEAGIQQYLANASHQRFYAEQINELWKEIARFLDACKAAGLDSSQVFLKGDVAVILNEVYNALVDFNRRLAVEHKMKYCAPLEKPKSSHQTLAEIKEQLLFQSRAIEAVNAA